jgi:superfamily II DNA or RNA helicase
MINEFRDIDNLSPGDFEIFVRDTLIDSGWSDATITKVGTEFRHGDGGVDIYAYKNKIKFAIEVKQRSLHTPVTVEALNQLVSGAKLSNVKNMILVTNSRFTSEVQARALRMGVELIDRDGLKDLFEKKPPEIARNMEQRDYQESVINDCINKYDLGKNKILIEMATGLGKTYTAALIIKEIIKKSDRKIRVLFLAHQIEILQQSATSFKNVFGIGNYSFSGCFAGSNPENTDFIFATFDTLYSKMEFLSKFHFDIIIVDEAHHTPAKTYAEVVNYFSPKLLIGLSATPNRMDNKDVFTFFGGAEGHIGKYTLSWALKHEYLAFPKYIVLLDDIDQSRLDQLGNGLSINDLDKNLFLHKKDDEVIKIIEETIQERNISNPKGIVFCQSISHMHYLINYFKPGTATLVHSQMKDFERRENIRNFRESGYQYILVCDLFNEGIDIPETNLLIFMRYTGSRTIWLQQLGRGLRKTKNKEFVYVLDFVGSLERLSEIQELVKSIEQTPLEPKNIDQSGDKRIVHDSSISVTYHQSAAQVLKLVEELEYRLKSREQLIDKLRRYAETNKSIPNITELESALDDITCDQIATHFDSYYRFIEIAEPALLNEINFKKICIDYINTFFKMHGIPPSYRAISLDSKHNGLIMYSESDIRQILGEESHIVEFIDVLEEPRDSNSTMHLDKPQQVIAQNDDETIKNRILEKYKLKISNIQDMNKLSESERNEIRKEFHSLFIFMNILKRYRENADKKQEN